MHQIVMRIKWKNRQVCHSKMSAKNWGLEINHTWNVDARAMTIYPFLQVFANIWRKPLPNYSSHRYLFWASHTYVWSACSTMPSDHLLGVFLVCVSLCLVASSIFPLIILRLSVVIHVLPSSIYFLAAISSNPVLFHILEFLIRSFNLIPSNTHSIPLSTFPI